MAFIIEHEFEVAASQETLWQVVTDFDRYADWNPFIVGCACDLQLGNAIDMQVVLNQDKPPRSQREYVTELDAGRHFAYVSPKNPTFLLRSYRSHTIEALANGRASYVSRFELHGWLVPLIRLFTGAGLIAGFNAMSSAIVARAEALTK